MGDLDNRGGCDDANPQALRDGEFETFCVGWVDIEKEAFVACFSEERNPQILNRRRKIVGYGLESGTKLIHDEEV